MNAGIRMTEGPIVKKLLLFAWPVFLGNLFQQLYNIADMLIVGNLLGNTALAAVSSTGSLVFLLVSLFSGISMGAGVIIARFFGARDSNSMKLAVHTNITFGLVSGLLMTIVGVLFSPQFLVWMDTPPEVFDLSMQYLQIYFAGSLGLVLYNTCTGIMQAVGDSRHPLQYLIISSCLNVALDFVMISVFKMGVDGAALATVISQFISMVLCLTRLLRVKEDYRLEIRKLGFDLKVLRLILAQGIPSGLQNSIIAIANVVIQSKINLFGEMAMAGSGAYAKLEGFVFIPITSFTMALTTFVGQNLGAREYERVKKGTRAGLIACIFCAEVIGVIGYILAPLLIGAFTSEPESIAIGVQRCRICAPFFFLVAASHGVSAVLRGAEKAMIPMLAMLICWCFVRVVVLTVVIPIMPDIAIIAWVYPLTWFLSTVFLSIYYFKANWLHAMDRVRMADSRP